MTSIVGTGSSATETVGGEDRSNRVSLWKIRTIFQKFCNTDGFLGYEDFKKLDNETEEEGSILDPEMFVQLCNFLCVADVTKGLSFVEYASIYLNETASETLESDLNADFATLFPDYSKVAMIFDAFDADADGVLNAVEFSNLVGGGEQLSEDAFKNLAFLFSFSPAQGLGIDHLISFYFTEQGKRAGFEPNLDGDFSMAAKMIGLE
jgi:hypothetical protein|eukprot:g3386.t1